MTTRASFQSSRAWVREFGRGVLLIAISLVALQAFFALRLVAMNWVDPQSSSFQRSEAWRLAFVQPSPGWLQDWRPAGQISNHLKRAVIASEDSTFADHGGVDWDAIEKAWGRNQRAQAQAERVADQQARRPARPGAREVPPKREPKVFGGSTISQQLAKNLFLSGERTVVRKAQELVITLMLEALLPKQRILEIYLNSVEWGEGVFGAQAAARYYYRVDAAQLSQPQAARLAVMLPAPKRFEKLPHSPYLASRSMTVQARMAAVVLP
jgi:monofunctional biosynthetic peptidoglycan transglycosylase